ncbi:MAG: GTP cyclohydrolase I FolE [Clostridia bacterium]|nr:MAG: GTP cyclohydrolase I FolE [Clostridia bacterium]
MDREKVIQGVRLLLEGIGEDLQREGLRDTPNRIASMCEEIFCGLEQDPRELLQVVFTEEQHEEIILVKDIPLYSVCEHHLLPFYGKSHVAYIPKRGRLTGLSKLARVVEVLAKRPQMQERLTSQIADTIMQGLQPRGVLVVVEAEHMCMTMRGVRKPGSMTVTSAVRGYFATNDATRAEAFALINSRGQ